MPSLLSTTMIEETKNIFSSSELHPCQTVSVLYDLQFYRLWVINDLVLVCMGATRYRIGTQTSVIDKRFSIEMLRDLSGEYRVVHGVSLANDL
jgi:hypothetical protein